MYYVYMIQSVSDPNQKYIGYTQDFDKRLIEHNSGSSHHTKQYKPWKMVAVIEFEDQLKAMKFEKYLKSCSGRAFAQKRFW